MSKPDGSQTEPYHPHALIEGILERMYAHPRMALVLGHSLSVLGGIALLFFGLPVAILPFLVGASVCGLGGPLAGVTTGILLAAWYYRKDRFVRISEFMFDLPHLGAALVGVGETGLREERESG